MDFGEAIKRIKLGARLRRPEWEENTHVYLEDCFRALVGKGGGMEHVRQYTAVLIRFCGGFTHEVGWHPTLSDLLADDWEEVIE